MPPWSVSSQVPPAFCAFWLRGSNVSLVLSCRLSPPGASCARGILTVTHFTESRGFFRTRLSSLFVELVKFLTPNIFHCHSFKIYLHCSQQMLLLLLLLWLLEMEFWVCMQLLNGKVCLWPPLQSHLHPFFYSLYALFWIKMGFPLQIFAQTRTKSCDTLGSALICLLAKKFDESLWRFSRTVALVVTRFTSASSDWFGRAEGGRNCRE